MKCTTLHLKGLSLTYKPRRGSTSPFMERNIRPELGQLAGHSDKEVPSLEVRITLQLADIPTTLPSAC